MSRNGFNGSKSGAALRSAAVDTHVGAAITAFRLSKGLSRAELAAEMAMSETELARYEAGLARPDPATLIRLAAALSVNVAEFFLSFDAPGDAAAAAPATSDRVPE